jgi:hypothetical protein
VLDEFHRDGQWYGEAEIDQETGKRLLATQTASYKAPGPVFLRNLQVRSVHETSETGAEALAQVVGEMMRSSSVIASAADYRYKFS